MTKIIKPSDLSKRLFIAIKLTPDQKFIHEYSSIKGLLSGEKIRWVKTENLHITMLFLGNTETVAIPEISRNLEPAIRLHRPFKIILKTLGVFRTFYNPKVLWAGSEHSDELISLKKTIDYQLKFLVTQRETNHFNFHLTLGRMKAVHDADHFREVIQAYQDFPFMEITIKEVILFESLLERTGPVYREINISTLEG